MHSPPVRSRHLPSSPSSHLERRRGDTTLEESRDDIKSGVTVLKQKIVCIGTKSWEWKMIALERKVGMENDCIGMELHWNEVGSNEVGSNEGEMWWF